ncbi:MAG: TonB-dependent receptor [Deltaproteobacteria bacterium]|nr:TonB-dependent receptor [Deltaproteobacteria bacterium]
MGARICAVVVTCVLGSGVAAAEDADPADTDDDLSSLSLEELMAVEVHTASFVLDKRTEQPVSMTTITRDDIDESGARTLNELLSLWVPGYFLVEDQDDTIAGFRGFAPDNNSKVLLLIDGRPVNAEWFSGPPDAILNGIDLGWIERVEVIRGPGSVTLGQGALLGVINVITTREHRGSFARTALAGGSGRLLVGRMEGGFTDDDLTASFYVSGVDFTGARLRDEGWAHTQENPTGVSVFDRGHRLKAANQRVALARVTWHDLTLQALDVSQWRDNYNFYRDREALEQRLLALTASYAKTFCPRIELEARVGYDRDQVAEYALDGTALAGTREDRGSGLAVVTVSDAAGANRLATGVEARVFDMGLPDDHGQNLIVNDKASRPTATSGDHTWVRPRVAFAGGLFAEYVHRFGQRVMSFAGVRFDAHQFWGLAWTPRAGALVHATPALDVRASVQSGFRGAVGVHYAGGFEHDGLLSAGNFAQVEANPLLASMGFTNLPETRPERMYSAELAARYHAHGVTVDGVAFADRMTHIIDAGVIFVGDTIATAPDAQRHIGTDLVGDWGGWFFFKNVPGAITSGGLELSVDWRSKYVDVRASDSIARILALELGADQIGNIYVSGTADAPHFRAYPEHVSRLNVRVRPCARCWVAASVTRFGRWYTPVSAGGVVDGASHAWADLAAGYRWRGLGIAATVKNATSTGGLWPMNSNAADPSASAGSPALERRQVWLTLTASR